MQAPVGAGTPGQVPYYAASGGVLTATSSITILSNGNVGIGTTSPSTSFAVAGQSYFSGTAFFGGAITATSTLRVSGATTLATSLSGLLGANAGQVYSFATSSIFGFTPISNSLAKGNFIVGNDAGIAQATSTIFISSTGSVGIGTTAPGYKLDVVHTSSGAETIPLLVQNRGGTVGTKASIGFNTFSSDAVVGSISSLVTGSGQYALTFNNWNSGSLAERMRIDSGGNLGIGVTPREKLDINGNITTSWSDTARIGMQYLDGADYRNGLSFNSTNRATQIDALSSDLTPYIAFRTGTVGSPSEKMRITSSGNVGIGTTGPAAKLEVQVPTGTIPISRFTKVQTTNDTGGWLEFMGGTSGTTQKGLVGFGKTGSGAVTVFTSELADSFSIRSENALHLGTNGNNIRMTIDTAGLVGIGMTNPENKLQVSGALESTGARVTPAGNGVTLSSESTYDALQSWNGRPLALNGGANNVGVASTTPWRTFSVSGTVALNGLTSSATGNALCITTTKDITDAGGASCVPSSIRFKENVETLSDGFALDELNKLRVVSFDYKDGYFSTEDAKGSYGLIAEEVADIDTKLVDYGYDGQPLTLKFEKLTGLAIQAIQELARTVKGFATSFTTAVLNAGEVNTSKLCVDGTCVTGSQLRELLNGSQTSKPDSGSLTSPPVGGPDAGPDPEEPAATTTSETGEITITDVPPPEQPPIEEPSDESSGEEALAPETP